MGPLSREYGVCIHGHSLAFTSLALLLHTCRQLDLHYPHFPSENNFIHQILKSDDLQEHFESGRLVLLSRFSMEWPRLKVGGLLLPRLVKFYQWLHTQLGIKMGEEITKYTIVCEYDNIQSE